MLTAALATGVFVVNASAQCVTAAPNSAPLPEDGWGQSVAISADGTTAITGAPYVDFSSRIQSAGAVRMLVNNGGTWEQQGYFTGGNGATNSNLGWSVDISADGNTAVAGQPRRSWLNSFDGVALVFVRNIATGTWSQQATLTDPTPSGSGLFGNAVSISDDGNTILVGQGGFFLGGTDFNAYVYTRTGITWSSGVVLPASPAPGESDEYGYSVALSPDGLIAAVGAPGRTNGPLSHGAVHVYRKNAGVWTQQQVLTRTVDYLGQANLPDRFGHALSMYASNGDATLAIGDPRNSDILLPSLSNCPPAPAGYCMVRQAGCVYLYNSIGGGAWTMSDQIHAPDVEFPENLQANGPDLDDRFGSSVALRGNHLVIGAPGDEECAGEDCQVEGNGSVYLFVNGQMLQKLTHPHQYVHDEFGTSVDIADDGQTYIAGAPRGDSPGVDYTGAVDIANSNISYPMIGVEPTQSAFEITITFPGNDPPPQTFTLHLTGRLFSMISSNCNAQPTAVAVQDYDGLFSVEQSFTIAMPGNQSVTFGPATLNTIETGHAAVLDPTGTGYLHGYNLGVTMPLLAGPESGPDGCPTGCAMGSSVCICNVADAIIDWCLTVLTTDPLDLAGSSPTLTVLNLDLTTDMELGLGANNPTIRITGGINVPPPTLPCPADINDSGAVNTDDLIALITTWGSCGDCDLCPADVAAPANCAVDTDDLIVLITSWGDCP